MKNLVDDLPASVRLQQAEMIGKKPSGHRAGQRDIRAVRGAFLYAYNTLQLAAEILALG